MNLAYAGTSSALWPIWYCIKATDSDDEDFEKREPGRTKSKLFLEHEQINISALAIPVCKIVGY